jgi:ATP/maltotriose-dependent transcriptional regulator MalT
MGRTGWVGGVLHTPEPRQPVTGVEIARALHISQATVKSHLIHTFGKLGVSDRTAAATVALERGMLRLEG